MDSPRLSRDLLAFLIGVPIAWAVLLVFHPTGAGDDLYLELQDQVTPWMVVHLGMVIFIPLMAGVVFLLVRGIEGTAARICRIALVPFVVFYSAWEVLMGIGTGVLVYNVNGLPEAQQASGALMVNDFTDNFLIRDMGLLVSIGSVALITALIAAGVALRRQAGVPLAVPVLLGLSAFLITAHPFPFGPTGLVLFVIAVVLYARSQSAPQMAAPMPAPG